MNPTLLAIDANNLTVRRYFSKLQGGFMIDKFAIESDAVATVGDEISRAALGALRQPVKAHNNVPHKGRHA